LTQEQEFSPQVGMKIVFFSDQSGTKIELIHNESEEWKEKNNSAVSIGIIATEYEKILEKAKEKQMKLQGPMTIGKEMLCFFINDPNGVGIQIIKDGSVNH